MNTPATHPVIVRQLRLEADGVVTVQLAPLGADLLPAWEPGSHLDLILPTGIERQYSLCGPLDERSFYEIGVRRDPASRGGSEYVHAFLRPGQRLYIKGPRNNFGFQRAASYLFIAGGIGITPILPMIRQAEAWSAQWRLVYAGRTASTMPFVSTLGQYGHRVQFYATDTSGLIPIHELLTDLQPGLKVYACGPASLLVDLQEAVAHHPPETLYIERFKPLPKAATVDEPVEIVCAASDKVVTVGAEQSILAALEDAGIDVPTSCRSGLCGSCETAVLDGVPDHRDEILTAADHAVNDRMYVCVSRAKTPRLVLDL